METKCTGKNITKLILIGSTLTTLIVLTIFSENLVPNISIKVRYSRPNGQLAKFTNVSAGSSNCSSTPSTSTDRSFTKLMHSFPWLVYKNATIQKDIPKIKRYSDLLLTSILIPFVIKEPPILINTSCQSPPLPRKPEKCASRKNGTSPKIGVIVNFSYDVDALEVHLHELDFLVDKFFLVEGIKINNRLLDTKQSIWDLVKYTARFCQFQSKIVHFIVDDSDYHEGPSSPGLWDRESLQGKLRVQKFLQWNQATGYFSPNDWIGIGDTDEIPSRQVINMLKNCEVEGDYNGAVDIGIWFPFPYDDTIFKTDFPVHSHPYTFGDPTYWRVSAVENMSKRSGTGRRSGQGKQYLLGGMHFSKLPYLPFQLVKLLTGSESQVTFIKWAIDIGMTYLNGTENDSDEEGIETAALSKWEKLVTNKRSETITSLKVFRKKFGSKEIDDIVKIPWFYQCNPGRYPGFRRGLDKRLLQHKK